MAATIYEPLSTAHLKSCTVDFDSRPDKKAVNLVQYDQTIPVLCVSLKKGGTEYKVPSDADVNIRMDKRDGYHVYNPALGVNAERTIAYFAVTPQMSTGWGDYYPIVEITVGGGIAGSAPIWLHFDRNPLPENAIISSDEYKTIQQLLEDVTAVKAATEQIKAQTEAVRDQAKGFADNAKNSADKAQTLVDGMPSDYSQAMKDIGTLKNQMQRAYPDDSTIGENPWSSKHIIDMLCPPLEESGNPVVCYPVAGYPLGVKAKWEPAQEGSGDPSPENIRPIKGRDGVMVERCGENILNPKAYTVAAKNGITFTINDDKSVHIIGTATGRSVFRLFSMKYKMLLPDGNYALSTITNIPSGVRVLIGHYDKNSLAYKNNLVEIRSGDSFATAFFQKVGWLDGFIEVLSGSTIDTTLYPMLVLGKTAPTTYTPYIGQTNTLTLPETVYGGEVDAVTGKGQETWQLLNNPSSYNYYEGMDEGGWVQSEDAVAWYLYNPTLFSRNTKILSNIFNSVSDIGHTAKPYLIGSANHLIAFRLPRSVAATGEDVKNWLASNNVEIAFETITQTPFTATGAQPIPAIAGVNTVLTDADSVTVMGRADPIKRITDLEDAVASQT